ncbi:hypothetical protein NP590_18205, partial [Methylomonas sp. SURF-2]
RFFTFRVTFMKAWQSPRQMNVNGVMSLVFERLTRDFQSNVHEGLANTRHMKVNGVMSLVFWAVDT